MNRLPAFLAALITCVTAAPALAAPTLYATGHNGTALVAIDAATAQATVIGTLGYADSFALAIAPNGQFYTVVDSWTGNAQLATVDPSTGVATLVGFPGFDLYVGGQGLGFSSDGVLYGTNLTLDQFYKVDTGTGIPQVVGSAVHHLGEPMPTDLAFSPSGVAYWMDAGNNLWTVDFTTLALTLVAHIELSEAEQLNVPGITFDVNGNLYLLEYAASSRLFRFDFQTGETILVGDTGVPYLHGADIMVASIPEPQTYALFLAALGVLGFLRLRNIKSGLA